MDDIEEEEDDDDDDDESVENEFSILLGVGIFCRAASDTYGRVSSDCEWNEAGSSVLCRVCRVWNFTEEGDCETEPIGVGANSKQETVSLLCVECGAWRVRASKEIVLLFIPLVCTEFVSLEFGEGEANEEAKRIV